MQTLGSLYACFGSSTHLRLAKNYNINETINACKTKMEKIIPWIIMSMILFYTLSVVQQIIWALCISGIICCGHAVLRPVADEERPINIRVEQDGFTTWSNPNLENTISFSHPGQIMRKRKQKLESAHRIEIPMAGPKKRAD